MLIQINYIKTLKVIFSLYFCSYIKPRVHYNYRFDLKQRNRRSKFNSSCKCSAWMNQKKELKTLITLKLFSKDMKRFLRQIRTSDDILILKPNLNQWLNFRFGLRENFVLWIHVMTFHIWTYDRKNISSMKYETYFKRYSYILDKVRRIELNFDFFQKLWIW
jgi:hypothetical protein